VGGALHLTKRFFGSLVPLGPSAVDAAWVDAQLLPSELVLWRSMARADRRHAAGVARRVEADLGPAASRPVLAAALLHDVGKTVSGLGTFRRVGATLIAATKGTREVATWASRAGWRRRVGQYVDHPTIGSSLLEAAESDPLTIAWTAEHHRPASSWTVPPDLGRALHDADDD
jgi:hypothetical protein